VKLFRAFIVTLTIIITTTIVASFFYAERNIKAIDKALDSVKLSVKTAYSNWEKEKQNSTFCNENSQRCDKASEQYSESLKDWVSQTERIFNARKQKPIFQGYLLMNKLDKEHVPDLDSKGLASLASACALLLFIFSIIYLLSSPKKNKSPRIEVKLEKLTKKSESAFQQKAFTTTFATTAKTSVKPDINVLLCKATECSESDPMQAISYLEQAIEESLGTKLSLPALLLCGSLRLKNKIGEEKGKEMLQKIISNSPQSPEAEKAKTVLDTFN
jgi:hypothetical protein